MAKKHLVWVLWALLAACTPRPESLSSTAASLASELGCEDAETRIFDRLINDPNVNPKTLEREFLTVLRQSSVDPKVRTRLERALRFLVHEVPRSQRLYAALELGLTPENDERPFVAAYEEIRAVWEELKSQNLKCEARPRRMAYASAGKPSAFLGPESATVRQGMRWAFAVAYQSCEALDVPALTSTDPIVEGITIDGWHRDRVGRKRFITDLPAVQRSHPYLRPPAGGPCIDVRENPLIYDYGGRPFITSSAVDLHQNEGTGTSALGIDCSAYVGTALATVGLKTKSSTPVRPQQAGLYSSHDFLNPEKEKLNCLGRIAVSGKESLRDGDIVAVAGHVLMVDRVGADPFGSARAVNAAECDALRTDDFDFEIYQSSPEKEGVGLNRFRAKDYLSPDGKMKKGLLKYAVQTCRNRLKGVSTVPKFTDISVVRHKGTKVCTDERVPLVREACVSSCFVGR